MIKITGKGNISAEIIADSASENGQRITTYVLEYPRFIHGEFMTHRLFSRNAASSRAIPVAKVIEQVENNPASPIHWGKNQAGMQAKEELSGDELQWSKMDWNFMAKTAAKSAAAMSDWGLHKQVVNRLLEPFQMIRVVCTATEYDNFFYLRNHADAQPEIQELARVMLEARNKSEPEMLYPGEWHTPFVEHYRDSNGFLKYKTDEKTTADSFENSWLSALKVSASCCAQVSFRKADTSFEKAIDIYARLVDSKPVHASPFEHAATPIGVIAPMDLISHNWPEGVTHSDKSGALWSGNFKGFVQYRQLIPNNVCIDYKE